MNKLEALISLNMVSAIGSGLSLGVLVVEAAQDSGALVIKELD